MVNVNKKKFGWSSRILNTSQNKTVIISKLFYDSHLNGLMDKDVPCEGVFPHDLQPRDLSKSHPINVIRRGDVGSTQGALTSCDLRIRRRWKVFIFDLRFL